MYFFISVNIPLLLTKSTYASASFENVSRLSYIAGSSCLSVSLYSCSAVGESDNTYFPYVDENYSITSCELRLAIFATNIFLYELATLQNAPLISIILLKTSLSNKHSDR